MRFLSPNRTNLCLVFLVPLLSKRCPVGLYCCHSLSPSLSAAVVVSIIHHLHSRAIYTTFYSQSAFTLCCLHLSTAIQIFRPVWAVLGRPVTSGPEKCIRWLPHINKCVPNESFFFFFFLMPCCTLFETRSKVPYCPQVNHNLWQPITGATAAHTLYNQYVVHSRGSRCNHSADCDDLLQLATCLRACCCARHFASFEAHTFSLVSCIGKEKEFDTSQTRLFCFRIKDDKVLMTLPSNRCSRWYDRLTVSQSSRLTRFLCHVGRVNREWTDYAL